MSDAALKAAAVPVVDNDVVRLFEFALAEAKAGNVRAAGVVIVTGPGQVVPNMAGRGLAELNLGYDLLKSQIMDRLRGPKASNIVRPGQVGHG